MAGAAGEADLGRRAFAALWKRKARGLGRRDPADVAALRESAIAHRRTLDAIVRRCDARLVRDEAAPWAADAVWTSRPRVFLDRASLGVVASPQSGAALGPGLKLHHDMGGGDLMAVRRAAAGALPVEVALETYGFDGGFVAFDFSAPDNLGGPGLDDSLAIAVDLRVSRRLRAYARLTVQDWDGERIRLSEVELEPGAASLEFAFPLRDAAQAPSPTATAWFDLVFESPAWCSIVLTDAVLRLVRPRGAGS